MGLLEFNKLPINTLVGADWKTFKAITAGREIDAAYKGKYRLTKAVCRLLSPLASLQDRRYEKLLANQPLEHDPVFILGHWRSGTTFVHNVFSCDKHFGYNTTYQTVFPHLMMWGQPFFKKNMSWLMPDKRPTDNMELAVDLPQEEEFALSNMMPYTYYNFWFLPKYQQEYADKYLLFDDITDAELKVFEEVFTKLIKISLWNTQGTQFLSKNPPHTGRVKELVKMFPNAKFIYLMRNPYTVFESTRSFFTNTIQPLKLEDVRIKTPICEMVGKQLSGKKLAVVPILRAGLGMVDGMLNMIPSAKVGHIGLYRDPETYEPVEYYCKLPSDIASREVFVTDPMLATGGSATAAITMLKEKGAKKIHFMCIIASPEGIEKMHEVHPDVDVFVGALDDHLNEHGYIVPGLGDAGDRIFGTK